MTTFRNIKTGVTVTVPASGKIGREQFLDVRHAARNAELRAEGKMVNRMWIEVAADGAWIDEAFPATRLTVKVLFCPLPVARAAREQCEPGAERQFPGLRGWV